MEVVTSASIIRPQSVVNRPNAVAVGTIVWLASEVMFFAGLFAIYSGDSFVFDDYGKADVVPMAPKKLGASYGGVAVGLGFVRSAVGQTSFYQILNEVRIKLGLQKRDFSAERTGGFLS
jgi:hypothetical protein